MNSGVPQMRQEPRAAMSESLTICMSGAAGGVVPHGPGHRRVELWNKPNVRHGLPDDFRHGMQWHIVIATGSVLLVKFTWP